MDVCKRLLWNEPKIINDEQGFVRVKLRTGFQKLPCRKKSKTAIGGHLSLF